MNQQEVPFKVVSEISREQLKRYANASGDHNQIHLDDKVAKEMGLPGVIAHGMLIAGMLGERGLSYFQEVSGKKGFINQFNSRFRAMVFPGDKISIGGTVKRSDSKEWVLDLQAKNQKGEITTTALMTILITQ